MPETRPSPTSASAPERGDALRSRTFRTLLFSELVSLIGDRLVIVALVALVYEQTRSAATVGILMLLKAVSAVALGGIACTSSTGGTASGSWSGPTSPKDCSSCSSP